jgi:hypothetical protein
MLQFKVYQKKRIMINGENHTEGYNRHIRCSDDSITVAVFRYTAWDRIFGTADSNAFFREKAGPVG